MTNEEMCSALCTAIEEAFGCSDFGNITQAVRDAFRTEDCELTITDAIQNLADNQKEVARSITACAAEGTDATGGKVMSLTESVMGVTAGLCRIADAIGDLAEAIKKD